MTIGCLLELGVLYVVAEYYYPAFGWIGASVAFVLLTLVIQLTVFWGVSAVAGIVAGQASAHTTWWQRSAIAFAGMLVTTGLAFGCYRLTAWTMSLQDTDRIAEGVAKSLSTAAEEQRIVGSVSATFGLMHVPHRTGQRCPLIDYEYAQSGLPTPFPDLSTAKQCSKPASIRFACRLAVDGHESKSLVDFFTCSLHAKRAQELANAIAASASQFAADAVRSSPFRTPHRISGIAVSLDSAR